MASKPANKNYNAKLTTVKFGNEALCQSCDTKCPAGKAHLSKLNSAHVNNCPVCAKRKD